MKVAYQGVTGSFSSMAARSLFGADIQSIQTRRFREIFEHLAAGRADIGVVPLENALAGSVHENYDLLAEFPCHIVAEYYCPVQLHLMAIPGAAPPSERTTSIREAVSHPKALEQCSEFLERHPSISPVNFSDTAGAAEMVHTRNDPTVAAIASEEAAERYGLTIIARAIQNHSTNSTRFVALANAGPLSRDANKCSLLFTLPHRPGSLHTVLGVISAAGFNMTKIESRPIAGRPYEYTFHLDIEAGSSTSGALNELVSQIEQCTDHCRVLGFYTAAVAQY